MTIAPALRGNMYAMLVSSVMTARASRLMMHTELYPLSERIISALDAEIAGVSVI